MNCPKCNYDNADNALFCANCGAKLETAGPYSPLNDPSAQLPVYGADQNTSAPDSAPYGGQQPQPNQFPTYGQSAPQQQQSPQNYSGYQTYNTGNGGYSAPPSYHTYNNYRPGQERDWAAIAALVCGILSLPCCFTVYGGVIVAICAVVFGILGIKSSKKAMAIVGLCLGVVGLICSAIVVFTTLSLLRDPAFMDEFMTEFENAMRS